MESFKDIIFKRVDGVDYSMVRKNVYLFNVFLSVDGERSVETIAREDSYDPEYFAAVVDKMEKIGLLVPVDGAGRREMGTQKDVTFNHIRNEDKAFAPLVQEKLIVLGKSRRNWLSRLMKRFFFKPYFE
jgi:hypothetical protein